MQSKERYLLPSNQSIDDIPNDTQHLFIYGCSDYISNRIILSSNSLQQLKSINFGNHGFKIVRDFLIDGLESLECVKFGDECFKIEYKKRDDGICRITNCPNLTQLDIGDHSFGDFKSFELSNLNSLKSIKFGRACFHYADLIIKGK